MNTIRRIALLVASVSVAGVGILAPSPARADTKIGTVYEHSEFRGARVHYSVSPDNYRCTTAGGDIDASTPRMPPGWNDRVSSFAIYGGCWTKIFEHSNYRGDTYGYAPDTEYLVDGMNDKTSSIRWT